MKLSSVLVLALTLVVACVNAEDAASSGTGFLAGVGAPMLDGSSASANALVNATAPAKSSDSTMGSMDHSSSSKATSTVGKTNSTTTTPMPSKTPASAGVTTHVGVVASVVTIAFSAAVALVC